MPKNLPKPPATLRQWLRRQTLRRRAGLIASAVLIALLAANLIVGRMEDRKYDRATVRLNEVVNAGTWIVAPRDEPDSRWTIHLLGVRTPQVWAEPDKRELTALLTDVDLQLVNGPTTGGPVQPGSAMLVYLPDGAMVNEWLLQQGLAEAADNPAHVMQWWFDRLQRRAKSESAGVWGRAGSR